MSLLGWGFWMMVAILGLCLAELIATLLFSRLAFAAGISVLREERPVPCPRVAAGSVMTTASGKFFFPTAEECRFRTRLQWFRSGWRTPLPIKGRICWSGSRATVFGRLPFFMPLYLFGWATIWVAFVISDGETLVRTAALLAAGPVVVVGLVAWSLAIEIPRTRALVEEFICAVQARL